MMPSSWSIMHGRYMPQEVLGTGTYGQVLRCTDTFTGEKVAVKVAHRDEAYRRSAMNEMRALQLLSRSEDSLQLLDFFEDHGCLCIVSELLSMNFYELLHTGGFRPLPLDAVRVSGECVLRALTELHRVGYMHCDIKPENVMLRHNKTSSGNAEDFTRTCLIDFGAVRHFHENTYYDVQSLWYRAPEVLLGVPYTPLIDSWSVGCLLFEFYTGRPLFPGEGLQEQLAYIVHTVGSPSLEAVTNGVNVANLQLPCVGRDMNIEESLSRLIMKYRHNSGGARNSFQSAAEEAAFVNLLCRLLQPDERRRMSCADALHHPFFTAHHSKSGINAGINLQPMSSCSSCPMMACDCGFGGGLSSTCSDAHSVNCFEHSVPHQQHQPPHSQSPPVMPTGCNSVPFVTIRGSTPAVVVAAPQLARAPNMAVSPPHLFIQGAVYKSPTASIAQQFPFTTRQQQQQHLINTPVQPMAGSSTNDFQSFVPMMRQGRCWGPAMAPPQYQFSPLVLPMSQYSHDLCNDRPVYPRSEDLLVYGVSITNHPHRMVYAPS
ncbi:putative protein kinase [Trypanosoma grayi]|uniref:putative protein kinase n=1 Tax=Trypanosoma grayi TaxID=71804 RepID=UPI0004F43EB3|nr:putative protein kinase [Trypanosoma grayi]KEG10099.1 putative protein kinase [Trypanosoma grayi]